MDEKVYHTKEEASAAINDAIANAKDLRARVEKGEATQAELAERMDKFMPEFENATKQLQELSKTLPETGISDKAARYEVPKGFQVKIDKSVRRYGPQRLANAYLSQLPAQRGSDLERYHKISDVLRWLPDGIRKNHPLVHEAIALERKFFGKVALDTTSESEWKPAEAMSSTLVDLVREAQVVAGAIQRPPMPNQVTKLPVLTADASVYMMSENTAEQESGTRITSSQGTSANATLTAKKFAVRVPTSIEMIEEAAFDLVNFLNTNLPILIAEKIDDSIINGDATSASSTHFDTARSISAATEPLLAWDGLRYQCNANSTQTDEGGDALVGNDIALLLGKMGKYGSPTTRGGGAVMFGSYTTVYKLAVLGAAYTAYTGLGANAPIISGAVGNYLGVEVVPVSYVPNVENSSGVYATGSAGTQIFTSLIAAARNYHFLGDRRMITVKSDEEITFDQLETVVTWRGAYAPAGTTSTTYPIVWRLYDIPATA